MTAKEFDGIVWDKRSVVVNNGVEHRVQGVNFKERFVLVVAGHVWWYHEVELPSAKVEVDSEPKPRLCRDGLPCMKPDMQCSFCVLNE